jgi:hypothetical protein
MSATASPGTGGNTVPRGIETGNHPNRKAETWRPRSGTTGPLGSLTQRYENLDVNRLGLSHEVWEQGGRYTGAVTHTAHDPYPGYRGGGFQTSNYVAGPFRTERRAQVASEALGRRAERGIDNPEESDPSGGYQTERWSEGKRSFYYDD